MILKLAAFSPTRTSTRPMKLRHSRSRTFLLSKLPFTNQHVTIPKRVYFSTKTTDTSESDSQQKTRSKFKSHYYLQGTITLALSLSIGVYVFNRNYPWFPGYLYQGQITDRYAVSSFVTRLPLEGNSNTNNSSETVQIRVFYPADLSKPLMSNSNAGKTEQFESNPEADSEVIKEQDRYYCRTAAIQGCCEARQSSQLYTWISHMLLGKKEHYLQLNRDILSMKFNFPLIIFSHGLYGVFDMYSTLCSDFASRGFVVFALEHEDGSAGYAEEKTSKRIIHYKRQPMASGSNTLGSDSNSDSDQQQQQDQFSDRIKIKEFRKPFLEKRCQEIEEVVGAVRFLQEKKQQQTQSEIESDTRYAKIRKVLQFTNTDQYHLIGHSFGGSTVVQYLREFNTNLNATNSRINSSNSSSINLKPIQLKSCIIMDLWSAPLQEVTADSGKINSSKQLQQYPPTLFLHSEGFSLWRKEEWNDTLQIFTQLCDNCQSDSMSEADKVLNPPLILLRDTKHHIFSDIPFWLPPSIGLVGDLVRGRESIQRLYKEYFCWKKMNEKVNCLSEKDVVLDVIYPQNQKQNKGNEVTASIQGGYYGEKRLESPKSNSNPMRFNLEKFNQDFFDKLKSSVITGSEYEKILKRRQYIADVAVDFMLKEGG